MTGKFKIKGFIKAGFIMIIILGGVVSYGISNSSQNITVNQGVQNYVDNFADSRAYDITSSMVDKIFMRISDDATYRVKTRVTEDLYYGEAVYTVMDTFFENENLIEIKVTAKFNDVTNIVTYNIYRETKRRKSINILFEYE